MSDPHQARGSTPPAGAADDGAADSVFSEDADARVFFTGRALGLRAAGSVRGAWSAGGAACVGAAGERSVWLLNAEDSESGLILRDSARSDMLMFMPRKVASVIFCTSRAWMVALTALVFWSSQKCTVLSS